MQVTERCFTNQYFKSTTRSRITTERVVSLCNIYSLWSFTHWFNSKNTWFAKILHKHWFSSIKTLSTNRNRKSFWTMSIQFISILPIFQTFSQKLQKQFILHCPKSFIKFLSECLVNLLQGKLKEIRKVDVVKYRRELSELTRRTTSLHKRRTISSSPKGFQLVSVITPFINKRLT